MRASRVAGELARRSRRFVFVRDCTLDVRFATQVEIQVGEHVEIDSDMGPRPRTPRAGDIVLSDGSKRRVFHPTKTAEFLGLPAVQVPDKPLKEKWREAFRPTFEEWDSTER